MITEDDDPPVCSITPCRQPGDVWKYRYSVSVEPIGQYCFEHHRTLQHYGLGEHAELITSEVELMELIKKVTHQR